MNKKTIILLWMCLTLLVTSACALGGLVNESLNQTTPESQETNQTPAANDSNTPAASENQSALDEGLGGLQSFAAHMIVNFEGQDDKGSSSRASLEIMDENNTADKTRHTLVKTTTQDNPPGTFEFFQQDAEYYIASSESNGGTHCIKLSGEQFKDQQSSILKPSDIFNNIQRGKLLESNVEKNGVITDHYNVNSSNMGIGKTSKMYGEIWIAREGNYVVRFVGSGEGQIGLLGSQGSGKLDFEYNLTGINDTRITLPTDCKQSSLPDLPTPANITNKSQMGPIITFTSPEKAKSVVDFYRKALPDNGWTINTESGAGGLFTLNASKENQTVQILITSKDGGCDVVVTQTK